MAIPTLPEMKRPIRVEDFDKARRLDFLYQDGHPQSKLEAALAWEERLGIDPAEFEAMMLKDLHPGTQICLNTSWLLDINSARLPGKGKLPPYEDIIYDSRAFSADEISAGCLSIAEDFQGYGYGAAVIRNLIHIGLACNFKKFEISAGSEIGGSAWAGIFNPVSSIATQQGYVNPVKKRIEILLPYLPEEVVQRHRILGHMIRTSVPTRQQMADMVAIDYDLAPILREHNLWDSSGALYKSFTSNDHTTNRMGSARERSLMPGGGIHMGRFLTVTSRWDGELCFSDTGSIETALTILNGRVERGKRRAAEKGLTGLHI